MTRKDDIRLADVYRAMFADADNLWIRDALLESVRLVADALPADNPRFSRSVFYLACCGLPSLPPITSPASPQARIARRTRT